MPFGWAALGAAAIGAAGSMSAADTQASAQKQAAATQQQMFGTINQQEQPFIQGGYGAENALLYGMGVGPQGGGSVPLSSFGSGSFQPGVSGAFGRMIPGGGGIPLNGLVNGTSQPSYSTPPGMSPGYFSKQFTPQDFINNVDPGYQFALQTGGQALRNQDTPGVGALSGAALKDLMNFNVGTANQYYQNAFNRFTTQQNNIFGRLSQIAGLGQSAATQVGNSGTALGTGIAQAQAAAGGSQAAGIVGASNAIGGSIPLAYLMSGQNSGVPTAATAAGYGAMSDSAINSDIGYPAPISVGGS